MTQLSVNANDGETESNQIDSNSRKRTASNSTSVSNISSISTASSANVESIPRSLRKRRRRECLTERGERTRHQRNLQQRRANETEAQYDARLQELRNNAAQRRANETQAGYDARLLELRNNAAQRRANETQAEYDARLLELRNNAARRFANESLEERLIRQQNDANQHREARRQRQINQDLNGPIDELNEVNVNEDSDTEEVTNRADVRVVRNAVTAHPQMHNLACKLYETPFDEPERDIKQMSGECIHCGALYFPDERNTRRNFTSCCMNGKINVTQLPAAHPTLHRLLLMPLDQFQDEEEREEIQQFRTRPRNYNSLFAFAGIHMNMDRPQGAF